MKAIVAHWTGGHYKSSAEDREHYHRLIEGSGKVINGKFPISSNVKCVPGKYAAHTLGFNTGVIGVSLCCMALAKEKPFHMGPAPMLRPQWEALIVEIARLCKLYRIPVTPKTVMSHAEVQANMGIRQKNKWDFTRLAFDPTVVGAKRIGDKMRHEVRSAMIDAVVEEPRNTKLAVAAIGGGGVGIGGTIVGASQDAQEFLWGIAPITDTVSTISNHAATVVGAATALVILGCIVLAVWKWARKEK